MKAMILAAGFGTRLWPLTVGRTKPAIPFLNRPLIEYTIEYLRRFDINELIVNLHHEPESIRQQIGDGSRYGVKIAYSVELPEILGTAGALDLVRERLSNDTFVVINGKIITDMDLGAALKTHRKCGALATLALRPNPKRELFREVIITEDGRIEGFGNLPNPADYDESQPVPLMFTGIHILEPGIFEFIPRRVFSDSVKDVYPKAIAAGKLIRAYIDPPTANSYWYELSTLDRYLSISLDFLEREGRDSVFDEGCVIEDGAEVKRSILWKRVVVKRGSRLSECIVGDDCVIPEGSEFHRAAIVRADRDDLDDLNEKPEKALMGEVIGGNLVVKFG